MRLLLRSGVAPVACGLWLCSLTPLHAQDLVPPREMGLPQAGFQMPDTNLFRIQLINRVMGWVIPDHTVPLVRLTAIVRAGFGDDRDGAVAEMLTWAMRTRGPCWLGSASLESELEQITGVLQVELGPEITEISLTAPSEEAEEAVRLFSGIIRETCLREDGLAEFKELYANVGTTPYAGSLESAVQAFRDTLFHNHDYRPGMTAEEVAKLDLEEVEEFYRDYFSPINTTLAISGEFRFDEMVRLIDQRFADWEERRLPGFRRADNVDRPDSVVVVRHPVDKLQTWVVMGTDLPPMRPREYAALEVMNYILGGGHFDTRLFRVARDERGLTNDASGVIERGLRGPGTYTFRTYGRPEVADSLIDIVFHEIERIQNEEVTEEELFVAKGALADGEFPVQFQNGHAVARTFALEWARYLTFDHLVEYQDRIRDVDAGDVRRAARRYLHPDQMYVVILESGS